VPRRSTSYEISFYVVNVFGTVEADADRRHRHTVVTRGNLTLENGQLSGTTLTRNKAFDHLLGRQELETVRL